MTFRKTSRSRSRLQTPSSRSRVGKGSDLPGSDEYLNEIPSLDSGCYIFGPALLRDCRVVPGLPHLLKTVGRHCRYIHPWNSVCDFFVNGSRVVSETSDKKCNPSQAKHKHGREAMRP